MTALYLLEPDAAEPAWAPFAGVRPVAELRAGIWRIRERWEAALQQDATGGRGVTWWNNISWDGGTAPTFSTAANARALFGFRVAGLDAEDNPWFYGFVHGRNFLSPDDAPPDYLFFDSFSSGSGSIDGRTLEYGAGGYAAALRAQRAETTESH